MITICCIVVEVGDDIRLCLNERTLVLVNHQSTADVPMLMTNFNSKAGVLPNIMWIMDRIFKFTNFGIISIIHQDFFILSVSNIIICFMFEIKNKLLYFYFSFYRAKIKENKLSENYVPTFVDHIYPVSGN